MPGHIYRYQNGAYHKFKKIGYDTDMKKVKKIGYFKNGVMHQIFTSASAVSYYSGNTLAGIEEIDEGLSVLNPQTISATKAHHDLVGWADSNGGTILQSKIADGEPMSVYACFRPSNMDVDNFVSSDWEVTKNQGSPTSQWDPTPTPLSYGVNSSGLYVSGVAWSYGNSKAGTLSSNFDIDPRYVKKFSYQYMATQSYASGPFSGGHFVIIEGYKNDEWVVLSGATPGGTYGQPISSSGDIDTYGCTKLRVSIGFNSTNSDTEHNRSYSTTLLNMSFYGDEGRKYIYNFGSSQYTWDANNNVAFTGSLSAYYKLWIIESRSLIANYPANSTGIGSSVISNEIIDFTGYSKLKIAERYGSRNGSVYDAFNEYLEIDVSGIQQGLLAITIYYSPYNVWLRADIISDTDGTIVSKSLGYAQSTRYYNYTYDSRAEILNVWLE